MDHPMAQKEAMALLILVAVVAVVSGEELWVEKAVQASLSYDIKNTNRNKVKTNNNKNYAIYSKTNKLLACRRSLTCFL